MISADVILDEAMNAAHSVLPAVFWNCPPRIIYDEDELYAAGQAQQRRTRLGRAESGVEYGIRKLFAAGVRRCVFDLMSHVATEMGHQDPFAIGPNEHTLIFRPSPLCESPKRRSGRITSTSGICIGLIDNELVISYFVDRLSRETQRVQGFRAVA